MSSSLSTKYRVSERRMNLRNNVLRARILEYSPPMASAKQVSRLNTRQRNQAEKKAVWSCGYP